MEACQSSPYMTRNMLFMHGLEVPERTPDFGPYLHWGCSPAAKHSVEMSAPADVKQQQIRAAIRSQHAVPRFQFKGQGVGLLAPAGCRVEKSRAEGIHAAARARGFLTCGRMCMGVAPFVVAVRTRNAHLARLTTVLLPQRKSNPAASGRQQ